MTKPTQDKETLREAVARAMAASKGLEWDERAKGTFGYANPDFWLAAADAAIAAMFERLRTPSEGMQDAGYDCLWDEDHRLPRESMNSIWQAMLTAFQQEIGRASCRERV